MCALACLQKFSVQFMTPNLHLLLCQLKKQCLEVGESFGQQEYWVERVIKKFKQSVANRSTKDPEKVLVNMLAIEYAYRSVPRRRGPSTAGIRTKHSAEPQVAIQALGRGTVLEDSDDIHTRVASCVNAHVYSSVLRSWDPSGSVHVEKFDRMELHGRKIAVNTYVRQESRDDSHVAMHIGTGTETSVIVGQVTGLFLVKQPPLCTVSFYVMELTAFDSPEQVGDEDLGMIYEAKDLVTSGPWFKRCFVLTNDFVIRKLVYTQDGAGCKYLSEYGLDVFAEE